MCLLNTCLVSWLTPPSLCVPSSCFSSCFLAVAYTQDRRRLSIWHIRPQPPGTHTIGSAYDLPALSPFGLGPMRTPTAVGTGAGAGAHSNNTHGSLPTFGSMTSAGTAAGGAGAGGGFGSVGGGGGGGYGSGMAAAAAASGGGGGYAGGPAAYSGSMLGMIASGGVAVTPPWSSGGRPGSFARRSVGTSTVKR